MMENDKKHKEYIKSYLPLIITGKLLGLYPFKIDVTGRLKIQIFPAIHSFFIFLFSLYNLFYISIWSDYLSSDKPKISIAINVYLFYKITEALIFSLSILNSSLNIKSFIYRAKKVSRINLLLEEIGSTYVDKKISKPLNKLF